MRLTAEQRTELRERGRTEVRRAIRKPAWWEGHTITGAVFDIEPPHTKRGYREVLCDRQGGEQRFCPHATPGNVVNGGWHVVANVGVEGNEEMLACETDEELDAVPAFWRIELRPAAAGGSDAQTR